jgi:hypothetical protein
MTQSLQPPGIWGQKQGGPGWVIVASSEVANRGCNGSQETSQKARESESLHFELLLNSVLDHHGLHSEGLGDVLRMTRLLLLS